MKLSRSLILNILLALLTATVIIFFSSKGLLEDFELSSLDLSFRLRGALAFSPKIIIIEISEYDIASVGRWPWKRSWHAALTKALTDMGAKEIYFDVVFPETSSEQDDALFEEVIKNSSRVYLPFAFQPPSADIKNAVMPLKRFSDYAKGSGAINIYPDSDGKMRRIPLAFVSKDGIWPHSILTLAMDYMGFNSFKLKPDSIMLSSDKKKLNIPVNEKAQMVINWAGKWQDSFKHYSFLEVLAAYQDILEHKKPKIDTSDFKNSVCLVGVTAVGLYDIKPIPIQPEYPGIGIFANALNNIIERNFMREVPQWVNILILYLVSLIPALLIVGGKPLREASYAVAAAIAYFMFNFFMFQNGIILELYIPIVGIFASYGAVSIYNFVRISVERQNFFKMSVTDGLTGLYNIRYFKMLLETEMMMAKIDPNKKFCIIMTDADHFKHFNDTYGHQVGDLVLKSIATVLKNSVRGLDIVARYGGEEMIVLLRGSSLKDGLNVAEKMRRNIESCIVRNETGSYKVTMSLGVSMFKNDDTVDTVIKRADDGLYKAKQAGRNRVECVEENVD